MSDIFDPTPEPDDVGDLWGDDDPTWEGSETAADPSENSGPLLDPEMPTEAPLFAGSSDDWNVGVNEDTGNTVSKWPGGRHFDNGTWDEVEQK